MQESNMLSEIEIINGCKKNKKAAQIALYEKYSPVLRTICNRYAKDNEEAEDLLHDGIIKILSNIKKYNEKGSFEGWLKRVTVNNAITYYHKNIKRRHQLNFEEAGVHFIDEDENDCSDDDFRNCITNAELSKDEMIRVISGLPDGFRMVFNLYVFENYSHKEIGAELKISVNTSKSQLSRARKLLQKLLYQYCLDKKMKNE
ncbi:MAG: sigma-70 family RNA polymerase sigma factor [Bacteroidota bacterium]